MNIILNRIFGVMIFLLIFKMSLHGQDNRLDLPLEREELLENNQSTLVGETLDNEELDVASVFQVGEHVDINDPNISLDKFPFLDTLQKNAFINYRKIMGSFLCKEELQAIPFWDEELVQKIWPFIEVGQSFNIFDEISKRIKNGHATLFIQNGFVFQRAAGYCVDTISHKSLFLGDRLGVSVKYSYQFKNLLDIGFCVDKDPGELLFTRKPFRAEFLSGHLFLKNF